ncbi:hypothetical protein F444_11291 [Phytophthora nicotianae P1976]|uniref:Uncharacterized protein n=1 Tax=Phytophthora nicotianae P1976 TaxID=1317066 RepID=A0A081A1C8_PHYNI|nr:hypothetical protein F444_11291 [Phytophthora nicotianae P1976]
MAGQPITAQHVCNECNEVADVCGAQLKVDTMTPVLHELGFRHLKGENRHIYAETPGNVAFRLQCEELSEASDSESTEQKSTWTNLTATSTTSQIRFATVRLDEELVRVLLLQELLKAKEQY